MLGLRALVCCTWPCFGGRREGGFEQQASILWIIRSPIFRPVCGFLMRCESHGSTSPCTFIRPRFPVTIPITGFSFIRIYDTRCPQPSWLPPCSHCGFGLSGRSGKSGSWQGLFILQDLVLPPTFWCRREQSWAKGSRIFLPRALACSLPWSSFVSDTVTGSWQRQGSPS